MMSGSDTKRVVRFCSETVRGAGSKIALDFQKDWKDRPERLNVKLLFLVVLLLVLEGCQGSGRFETSPIGPFTISNGTSEAAN